MTSAAGPIDVLSFQSLGADDLDRAPYGFIVLDTEGTVVRYNRTEAEATGRRVEDVLGRSWFREVAPCTMVKEFEGVFRDFVERRITKPSHEFDFVFRFRDRPHQEVRIRLVRSAGEGDQVLVIVTRTGGAG